MTRQLTYLGTTLLVAGLTKNYFYYRAFNIRILDYIELTETLSIITEASIFIMIVIPFTWFMHFMLDVRKEHITEPDKNRDLVAIAHEKRNFFKRLVIYLLRYWGATLAGLAIYILSLFDRFLPANQAWILTALVTLMLSMTIYIIILLEFRYKYKRIFEKELDNNISTTLHYGGMFLIFMSFYTYMEIRTTKSGNAKEYVIELVNGESILTTNQLISIGQTKNYFFIYDRIREETTVIKMDFIKRIKIKAQQVDSVKHF